MEKLQVDSKDDIAQERYKGTGPVVASAGYVYITHWVGAAIGAVALGALGALASGKTLAIKEAFTNFGSKHADSANFLKKSAGFIAGGIPKIADYFATKFAGAAKQVSGGHVAHLNETTDKAAAVAFASGVGAASGWIGSTIWGIVKGGHEGSQGKQQFNRAKAEITDLRARNDDLENINNALHKKYVEAASQKDADEQEPASNEPLAQANAAIGGLSAHAGIAENHTASHPNKPAHSIQTHGDHAAAEHHGKVHAHAQHEQAAQTHA